jgi:hypothetical protein
MGLGDWVRVVGRFAGDAGFGGIGQERSRKSSLVKPTAAANAELADAQWQPSPVIGNASISEQPENTSPSDEFVETLSQDIQVRGCLL